METEQINNRGYHYLLLNIASITPIALISFYNQPAILFFTHLLKFYPIFYIDILGDCIYLIIKGNGRNLLSRELSLSSWLEN